MLIRNSVRAGEVAQWLRALAALVEDLGSVPSTHTVCNPIWCILLASMGIRHACSAHTYMQSTHTHKNNNGEGEDGETA